MSTQGHHNKERFHDRGIFFVSFLYQQVFSSKAASVRPYDFHNVENMNEMSEFNEHNKTHYRIH